MSRQHKVPPTPRPKHKETKYQQGYFAGLNEAVFQWHNHTGQSVDEIREIIIQAWNPGEQDESTAA